MYIEDIIDSLVGVGSWVFKKSNSFLSVKDITLLTSFDSQTGRGLGLTEKQRNLAMSILKKYNGSLNDYFSKRIDNFLDNPQFKLPKRVLSQIRTVTIIADSETNIKKIRLAFPYDENLIATIKEYRVQYAKQRFTKNTTYTSGIIEWNNQTNTWDLLLYEEHVDWIYKNLSGSGFTFDDEFLSYVEEINNIKNTMENYIPMVIFNGTNFELKNSHKNIPAPTSDQLLDVLFEAKKYGISTWDENIDIALSDISINDFTRDFLKNTQDQITVTSPKYQLVDIEETVNHLGTLVVVVPGGSELEGLSTIHKFMKNIGISDNKMSVLFRVDSSAGKICNEYIRENNLNNSISENTKIIFISIKVPKPLLASGKTIDAIINLGSNSAHYSVKSLLKNHQCVINYNTKQK
jgi:hypothetical protein